MKLEETSSKRIFLTFDDGPNEPYTSQILDILKEWQCRASFFVCGKNVEYYRKITRRIADEGHVIGNHTYSHSRILTYTGMLKKEIEKTFAIIHDTAQVDPIYFRPPWGIAVPWLKNYLMRQNYHLVLWDIAAADWERPPAHIIFERIIEKVKANSIILLHDGNRTHHNNDRSQTVAALPLILKFARAQGYKCEGVDTLIAQN